MKAPLLRVVIPFVMVNLAWLAAPERAHSERIWTNSASGLWRDGQNWTGHLPPDVTSFMRITNDSTKTVTVDSLTAVANLTVQKLTISAPPGATNTLLLSSVGVTNPLIFQTGLEMQDGAAIEITNSALQTLLTNDHVNIDGTLTLDSGLIDFGDITVTARVGRVTSGTFSINGGTVLAGVVTVGGLTNSSGLLNLSGGTLNVASFLSVGRNLSTTGTMSVLGGQLNVTNDDTRVGDDGVGQMTISNSTAALNTLQVGRDNTGLFTLETGAQVSVSSDTSIGRFFGGTGTVAIAGGQLNAGGQNIYIGRGGSGQFNLSGGSVTSGGVLVAADSTNSIGGVGNLNISGGSFAVSSNLFVGSASYSTGQVSVTGGTLVVSSVSASAVLAVTSGSFNLAGGSLATDNLSVTNPAGQFNFSSGTFVTKGTTISNGLPFVVGDGVAAATLQLNGGIHFFLNGLTISSNATLSGCGTIIGSIINLGTVATNCGGTLLPPSINSPPQNQIIAQGGTAAFSVLAAGTAPLSYQWMWGGVPVSGATSSVYAVTNAQTSADGAYSVVVTNSAGSITSAVATLTVILLPSITLPPQSQTVAQGGNVTFSVTAVGTPPLAYQWQFNGTNIAGATNSVYTKLNVQPTDAGSYAVSVTNLAGSVVSPGATLALVATPAPVLITFQQRSGVTNVIAFPSLAGSAYLLQAMDSIYGAGWTNLPPATNGTGNEILLLDTNATGMNRFYRVQIQ